MANEQKSEPNKETDVVADDNHASHASLRRCATADEWSTNLIRLYRETRDEDLAYLREHPEIQEIIELLVNEIQKNKPQNLHRFVALYFQHNRHKIALKSNACDN